MLRDAFKQPRFVLGSGRRDVLQSVAQTSAQRETSYRSPLGSGTRRSRFSKAARKCGMLGNAKGDLLRLYSVLGDRACFRTS